MAVKVASIDAKQNRIKVITLCSKVWLKQSERTSEQWSQFFRLQIVWYVEVRGGRVVDSIAFGWHV